MLSGLKPSKPFVVNCLRYGSLFCGAEVLQQYYLKKHLPKQEGSQPQPYDATKLKNMAVFGYVFAPSYMALWYKWLEPRYPGTALKTVVTKVVLDQTLLTIPILCMFFPWMSYCDGKENIFRELIDKFVLTYTISCTFWLPAQALNFRMVPPRHRILFNGAAGFIWAFILCIIKRQGEDKVED